MEFEAIPTKAYTQRVFQCPIHEDPIILPWGYHYRFIRVVSEGRPTSQYLPYWMRLHGPYEIPFVLSYPRGSYSTKNYTLGGVNRLSRIKAADRMEGVRLGYVEPYAGAFVAEVIPLEERLRLLEERAREIEEMPPEAIPLAEKLKKYLPWMLVGMVGMMVMKGAK